MWFISVVHVSGRVKGNAIRFITEHRDSRENFRTLFWWSPNWSSLNLILLLATGTTLQQLGGMRESLVIRLSIRGYMKHQIFPRSIQRKPFHFSLLHLQLMILSILSTIFSVLAALVSPLNPSAKPSIFAEDSVSSTMFFTPAVSFSVGIWSLNSLLRFLSFSTVSKGRSLCSFKASIIGICKVKPWTGSLTRPL